MASLQPQQSPQQPDHHSDLLPQTFLGRFLGLASSTTHEAVARLITPLYSIAGSLGPAAAASTAPHPLGQDGMPSGSAQAPMEASGASGAVESSLRQRRQQHAGQGSHQPQCEVQQQHVGVARRRRFQLDDEYFYWYNDS